MFRDWYEQQKALVVALGSFVMRFPESEVFAQHAIARTGTGFRSVEVDEEGVHFGVDYGATYYDRWSWTPGGNLEYTGNFPEATAPYEWVEEIADALVRVWEVVHEEV